MADKEKDWKGVTGGSTLGQKALKMLFSIVSVRIGYAILVFIIPFYMLFARKGYLAIYRYFRLQHHYSPLKSFWKTYRNHYLFGQVIMDRFAVFAGKRNIFRIDNPDNDVFISSLNNPEGFIMATSHMGNPELCGYVLKQNKKRINGLIFGGESKEVQKNRVKIAEENNMRLLSVSNDLSHIFLINEALSNGEILNVPSDRIFGSEKSIECDFLNGKANFPVGTFVLAVQYNVPVLAYFVLKESASCYHVYLTLIQVPDSGLSKREQINEMTRIFVCELEKIVKIYPEQWFNFYNFWKNENVSCT